jgi:hypothetical protein
VECSDSGRETRYFRDSLMTIGFPDLGRTGRLGNQLWQIASTLGVGASIGEDVVFPEWDYAPFFSLPPELFSPQGRTVQSAHTRLLHMDERARAYMQDYHLFQNIETQIRSWLQPSEKALDRLALRSDAVRLMLKSSPSVSLHVRRGDNVTHPIGIHPLRTMDYFRRALNLVETEEVFVFSDDPEWCRSEFPITFPEFRFVFIDQGSARPPDYLRDSRGEPSEYIKAGPVDWEDLHMMGLCRDHIISNSTYAWWGAFVAQPGGLKIYPTNWFGRQLRYIDSSLMFPVFWTQVEDNPIGA